TGPDPSAPERDGSTESIASTPQEKLLQQVKVSSLVVPDPGEDTAPAHPGIPQQHGGAGRAGTGGRGSRRGGGRRHRRQRGRHGGRVAKVAQVSVEGDS